MSEDLNIRSTTKKTISIDNDHNLSPISKTETHQDIYFSGSSDSNARRMLKELGSRKKVVGKESFSIYEYPKRLKKERSKKKGVRVSEGTQSVKSRESDSSKSGGGVE